MTLGMYQLPSLGGSQAVPSQPSMLEELGKPQKTLQSQCLSVSA